MNNGTFDLGVFFMKFLHTLFILGLTLVWLPAGAMNIKEIYNAEQEAVLQAAREEQALLDEWNKITRKCELYQITPEEWIARQSKKAKVQEVLQKSKKAKAVQLPSSVTVRQSQPVTGDLAPQQSDLVPLTEPSTTAPNNKSARVPEYKYSQKLRDLEGAALDKRVEKYLKNIQFQ